MLLTILFSLSMVATPVFADGENMFEPAGSSEVAISGEPIHVGDVLSVSILVHNQGSESGVVRLKLTSAVGENLSLGAATEISPGSSREVVAEFSPLSAGMIDVFWEINSDDGAVSSDLQGSFEIQVLESQSLSLNFMSTDWTLADGLDCYFSITLSEGKSRLIEVSISLIDSGESTQVQNFEIMMNPGIRSLNSGLGHPDASMISISLSTLDWSSSNSISNLSWEYPVMPPTVSTSVSIGQYQPESPNPGEMVSVDFTLNNSGDSSTLPGILRFISNSDGGMILAEIQVSAISAGGSSSGTITVGPWPDSQVVEAELIWSMDGSSASSPISISTESDAETGIDLPFDITAALYGAILGFAVVLIGMIVTRALSERTPSTGSGERVLRESRITIRQESSSEKREVPCPSCNQRLKIPVSHTGMVKCPACSSQFSATPHDDDEDEKTSSQEISEPVIELENPSITIVSSSLDELPCPECQQMLRIPLERRPVNSRCPACRTEFLAEVGRG
tara:strand:+ start:4823 stop:6349 length:1527 start_codon:yes stop_codon:yes gene_type:complete